MRACFLQGALQSNDLKVHSSFHNLGPTRHPWPNAAAKGEQPTLIDFACASNTLQSRVFLPEEFPQVTRSDHSPIAIHLLAPKSDRRRRRRMMENLLRKREGHLPARWAPRNHDDFRREIHQIPPRSLQQLAQDAVATARRHTRYASQKDPVRTELLKGLREAPDPTTRRAYQIMLRTHIKEQKTHNEYQQLQKWARGQNWTFAQPHRLPGPLRIPARLNEEEDRGKWGTVMEEHFGNLYGASEKQKDYTWAQLDRAHEEAFCPNQTRLSCDPLEIKDIISKLPTGKAGGGDGMPSQKNSLSICSKYVTLQPLLKNLPTTLPISHKSAHPTGTCPR